MVFIGDTFLFNVFSKVFKRGEVSITGACPYLSGFKVPALSILTETGNQRGGFRHLAGMCPKNAMELDTKFVDLLFRQTKVIELDSDNSSDDPTNPPVVSLEETPDTVAELFTQPVDITKLSSSMTTLSSSTISSKKNLLPLIHPARKGPPPIPLLLPSPPPPQSPLPNHHLRLSRPLKHHLKPHSPPKKRPLRLG